MQRILIPIDFSDHSLAAARLGVAVAARFSGRVTLLHALDLFSHTSVPPQVFSSYKKEQLDSSTRELQALKDDLAKTAENVEILTEVIADEAAHAILSNADTTQADLIVMGSYGSKSGERFALGSVANRVGRRATCPLLITRAQQPAPANGLFRQPMVAVDYSKFSVPSVELAVLLSAPESVIEMLHIVHWPGERDQESLKTALGEVRASELERLQTLSHNIDIAPVRVAVRTEVGRVAGELISYVESSDIDLVVVGAHGSPDRSPYIGTVADRVLRTSAVPVLLLPEEYVAGREP